MKKLEQKFDDLSHSVHLTEAEKISMREYLVEYQAMRPVRNGDALRHKGQAVKSPLQFLSSKFMPIIAALILMLAGGATVSAAAQHALPGDALYPIKVSVNEKVAGAFAISDDAKAAYETSLASERLSEAEQLSADGKLSTTTEDALQADFTAHTENAKDHIVALGTTDSTRAEVDAQTLSGVLAAHERILSTNNHGEGKGKLIMAIRSEAGDDTVVTASASSAARLEATAALRPQDSAKTTVRAILNALISTTTDNDATTTVDASSTDSINSSSGSDSHEGVGGILERDHVHVSF